MLLSHVIRTLCAWKRYNASVRELSQLNDRELADIGLTRAMIPSAAFHAAWDRDPRVDADAGAAARRME